MPVQDYSKRINRAGMVGAIVTANVRAIVADVCSGICSGVYWDIYYGGCCGRLFGCSLRGWSEQLLRGMFECLLRGLSEQLLRRFVRVFVRTFIGTFITVGVVGDCSDVRYGDGRSIVAGICSGICRGNS